MSIAPVLMTTVEVESVLAQWKSLSAPALERLIVCAAIALVAISVWVWAVFFRKSRRHHHHHRHYPSDDSAQDASADGDEGTHRLRRRRKWRRPRREHRPRNPTLAETGGLPPARTGEPPEPRV